ncbi:GTP cyclohydrolase I FolE [Elusimicrobiota bacterium]
MDKKKIEKAVLDFLTAIGEDPARQGLKETPARVARMCGEILSSYDNPVEPPPVYFQTEKYSEIILIKDIAFHSICEHHLLPFYGKAHVAYIPSEGNITGLSKIARLVEAVSSRLQLQERLTEVIADSMVENLNPLGSMVIIEAEHLCMIMRGVKKPGSKVITSAMRGVFLKDARTRSEALALIRQN